MRLAARLTHAGAAADDDWATFAPDEFELVKIATAKEAQMVRRRDVPGLIMSSLFGSAWKEWSRFRRFGLPHGMGWRAERPTVIRAIEVLEQEFEGYQADEMERRRHG